MGTADIDAIDRKILAALQVDARIPVTTLARQIHLSRHAVRYRMERLEAMGVIAGYTIRLGDAVRPKSRAILQVYRKDRMRGQDVTDAIARIPEVTACYVVSGDSDLILLIEAESQEHVGAIWSRLSHLEGVVGTNTSFVLSCIVDRN